MVKDVIVMARIKIMMVVMEIMIIVTMMVVGKAMVTVGKADGKRDGNAQVVVVVVFFPQVVGDDANEGHAN